MESNFYLLLKLYILPTCFKVYKDVREKWKPVSIGWEARWMCFVSAVYANGVSVRHGFVQMAQSKRLVYLNYFTVVKY